MDTFDLSFDPGCCRLLSERRKIRRIKKGNEQRHVQLYKESVRLSRQRRKTEPVPLEKPYQDGWVRYFVLREDVERGPNAELYEHILRVINTYTYSKNKKFVRKKGRKDRKPNYVPIRQELRLILPSVFDSPKFPLTDAEKALFRLVDVRCYPNQQEKQVYVFIEPWRFVQIVKPYMVTEMIPVDSELESRLQLIDNYFERQHIPLCRYKSGKWKYRKDFEREKYRDELKQQPLYAIIAQVENEHGADQGSLRINEKTKRWEI